MTATATTAAKLAPDIEAATARLRETGEHIYDSARKATNAYLDGVERYISGLTQAERKLGEQAAIEPFTTLVNAHASLTEDFTHATFSAARDLIAA